MYTNRYKTNPNDPKQVLSHDLWISMDPLQHLAKAVLQREEQPTKQGHAQQVNEQRQQSWVKWPEVFKDK